MAWDIDRGLVKIWMWNLSLIGGYMNLKDKDGNTIPMNIAQQEWIAEHIGEIVEVMKDAIKEAER